MLTEYLRPILEEQLSVTPTEDQYDRMAAYWHDVQTAPLNLTAIKEDAPAALLHFADSLAPLAYGLIPPHASVIDVGTGGGFPSVPLAILRDDISVTALDATRKKLSFITEHAPCTNLKTLHARAEDAGRNELRESFDLSCARAVAALPIVLEYLAPFVKLGGHAIAYKADISDTERAAGQKAAQFLGLTEELWITFSLTGTQEVVNRTLCVYRKEHSTASKYPRSNIRQKPLV